MTYSHMLSQNAPSWPTQLAATLLFQHTLLPPILLHHHLLHHPTSSSGGALAGPCDRDGHQHVLLRQVLPLLYPALPQTLTLHTHPDPTPYTHTINTPLHTTSYTHPRNCFTQLLHSTDSLNHSLNWFTHSLRWVGVYEQQNPCNEVVWWLNTSEKSSTKLKCNVETKINENSHPMIITFTSCSWTQVGD